MVHCGHEKGLEEGVPIEDASFNPDRGYQKEAFMLRVIWVALAALMVSLYFVPAVAFGQGQGKAQKGFATAQDAAKALVGAYKKADVKALVEILGSKGHRLVSSGDPVEDRIERDWFVSLYEEGHEIQPESKSRAVLELGNDGQPYPIPVVKKGGNWFFDPGEGHEELLSRRISKNELSALNVVVAYVEAQKEYHEKDHDGDKVFEYAQRWRSAEGTRDGLYWKGRPGGSESPISKLAEVARGEGYPIDSPAGPFPYRGYYYKILKAQGPNAPGGAIDYVKDGNMVSGFALIAYPARYNVSGIMTFMVNQEGVVYQKDLGSKTAQIGKDMTLFDPDKSWSKGKN
jgi:hypothetical protein